MATSIEALQTDKHDTHTRIHTLDTIYFAS